MLTDPTIELQEGPPNEVSNSVIESATGTAVVGQEAEKVTWEGSDPPVLEDNPTLTPTGPVGAEMRKQVDAEESGSSVTPETSDVAPLLNETSSVPPPMPRADSPVAKPAKPKRLKRARKSDPKHVVEVVVDPVPADEIAVIGNADDGPAGTGGANAEDAEVVSENTSSGQARAKGNKLSKRDLEDFKRLHQIVLKCGEYFVDAGNALREIRDRGLWRGEYPNWNAYCESVQGITRRYANILISTSEASTVMCEVGIKIPTSTALTPRVHTQIIPLLRVKDPNLRRQAWDKAVNRAGGKQPKTRIIAEEVARILAEDDKPGTPAPVSLKQSRVERRTEVLGRLKTAVEAREDWNLVAQLLIDLEDLL